MTKKQMERDLCSDIIWMLYSDHWNKEFYRIKNSILLMKRTKSIRLYKKRYKLIREIIDLCMKYDIINYRYDEFMEFVERLEE